MLVVNTQVNTLVNTPVHTRADILVDAIGSTPVPVQTQVDDIVNALSNNRVNPEQLKLMKGHEKLFVMEKAY